MAAWRADAACFVFAVMCYLRSLRGELFFDDEYTVVRNTDVRGATPLLDIFAHDFWGLSISSVASHKSYRPLTTLTYRLNHNMHGLDPLGYHAINVLLHGLVTVLVRHLCLLTLRFAEGTRLPAAGTAQDTTLSVLSDVCSTRPIESRHAISCGAFVGGVLFAVHPVHTDAVSSVTGRADVLAALFFVATILVVLRELCRSCNGSGSQQSPGNVRLAVLVWSSLFATLSLLCKELGITALPICAVLVALDASNRDPRLMLGTLLLGRSGPRACSGRDIDADVDGKAQGKGKSQDKGMDVDDKRKGKGKGKSKGKGQLKFVSQPRLPRAAMVLLAVTAGICFARLRLNGQGGFSMKALPGAQSGARVVDAVARSNPAAASPVLLTRALTYQWYWLLYAVGVLFPLFASYCPEWAGDAVPLLESWSDTRVVLLVLMHTCVLCLLGASFSRLGHRSVRCSIVVVLAVALGPFALCSNVIVTTGTVVAERVMYIPSIAFSIAVAAMIRHVLAPLGKRTEVQQRLWWTLKWLTMVACAVTIVGSVARTVYRDALWRSEQELFCDAAEVQGIQNVNLHAHCGAARRRSDPLGSLRVLQSALRIDPEGNEGAIQDNMANVLSEQLKRPQEAAHYYKKAIEFEAEEGGSNSRFNLGALLFNQGKATWAEALQHWKKLERYLSSRPISGWSGASLETVRNEIMLLEQDIKQATADGTLLLAQQGLESASPPTRDLDDKELDEL